ncbi:MAG: NAD(P)-dependent oxidoreductase [Pyramidobacter sp.]|nr:NAD(P)-dependent oxidoreductase [Pyramidobacter sp.]
MKPVVTVIEPEGPPEWFSCLNSVADVRFYVPDGPMKPETVSEILKSSRGVIITSATSVSAAQIDAAEGLGIIAKCGGPPSNVDIAHAEKSGVAVSCCPGANTTSIAEYTVMLIIAMLRRFDLHISTVRQGKWRTPTTLLGHDLRGAVVGLVGLGAIGKEVLRRLEPFACSVLIYSPHAHRAQELPEGCRFVASLEEMLPQCDAVTLHCKVTEQTTGMFNKNMFQLMKQGAVFINTARGALVNEEDLAAALETGRVGAAAVDVFQTEPPSADNPLRQFQNAVLTPHSAGWTTEALWRECDGAARSALAFLTGTEIPGLLTPDYAKNKRVLGSVKNFV